MTTKQMSPSQRQIRKLKSYIKQRTPSRFLKTWYFLTNPHSRISDIATRRKSRLLAIFLLGMIVLFAGIDILFVTTDPTTRPVYEGYAFLLTSFFLNRAGYYKIAAFITIVMFPIVITSQIQSGNSLFPTAQLSYLVLELIIASILLSQRSVLGLTIVNIMIILIMPRIAPEVFQSATSVFTPIAINGIGGLLLIVAMHVRNQIEKDRNTASQEEERKRQEWLHIVVDIGQTLAQTHSLDQCLKTIHACVQDGLNFDRVGVFLVDSQEQLICGTYGTDRVGQINDNSAYIAHIDDDPNFHLLLDANQGFLFYPEYSKTFNIHPDHEMFQVREHVSVTAWSGETPIAIISADNLLTQRSMKENQIEALRLSAGHVALAIENARLLESLSASEQEVRTLNAELEERVEQRTAELKAANEELESFSYSVSHDLRAPLRAINGFSKILMDTHGAALPEEALKYQEIVRQNSIKMGQLIDALLAFSRMGRKEIHKSLNNPLHIIKSVLADFEQDIQSSQAKIIIGEQALCQADPTLLQQVFANLISNALKFSQNVPSPVIEIGCDNESQPNIFFVKDNGIGFEMDFADKIFEVFQRLHGSDEYEGTGIGLAITKRIVTRHGGRIWVESVPGEGTTFCFTLEADPLP
jgi:signal transduction histidine kinase